MLPTKNGDIDWDAIADDYHSYVLSPYAPEMTTPAADGRRRNRLLDYLYAIAGEQLAGLSVADFGCGPGNLIPHLSGRVRTVTCVDRSRAALAGVRALANRYGVAAETVCADIAMLDDAHGYDLIVSVNALLPESRRQVRQQLAAICRCLNPGGRLLAILPSFDTTEYLCALWRRHYMARGYGAAGVAARVAEFERSKKMDRDNLRYADDGCNAQCYHTVRSIRREFGAAGLAPLAEPEKVYYPWALARRFGYGYFPDADEEIWDWFVVAGKSDRITM